MKTLYLVRHAKSSWGDPALPDRDRPVNERGLRDVATMGKRLAQRGVSPDVMLCSRRLARSPPPSTWPRHWASSARTSW